MFGHRYSEKAGRLGASISCKRKRNRHTEWQLRSGKWCYVVWSGVQKVHLGSDSVPSVSGQ